MASNNKLSDKEKLERAFEVIMAHAEGVEVLRHIMELSGYQKELMTYNNQFELNTNATIYNLSKRDIWIEIRKLLSAKNLSEIENPKEGIDA